MDPTGEDRKGRRSEARASRSPRRTSFVLTLVLADLTAPACASALGSAVALRMLGGAGLRSEFADVVDRVGSVVLLSPLDVRVEQQYETFMQIAEISDLEIALGELSAVLPARIVEETICGGRDETPPCSMAFKIQAQLREAYLRILPRAKHTLPTERPWTCARLVRTFVESRGNGRPAILEVDEDHHGRHLESRDADVTADRLLVSGRW